MDFGGSVGLLLILVFWISKGSFSGTVGEKESTGGSVTGGTVIGLGLKKVFLIVVGGSGSIIEGWVIISTGIIEGSVCGAVKVDVLIVEAKLEGVVL